MKVLGLQLGKGDVDGFLGILVDNLSVILTLIALNLYVVGMPADIVFGRILPGAAIGLLAGNIYYAFMAARLAKKEQRSDVTALPSGISIVFVITYTMGILLPVAKLTGDPEMAWRIGLAANIIGAVICLIGAFIGPWIRKFLPPVSMLGALGGLAVVFIAGMGLKDIFSNPIIGFVCLGIIVWGYLAGGKLPFKIPAGLFALIIGAIIALCMGQTAVNMGNIGVYAPFPWILKVGAQAFRECGPYLAIIIPIAVINFISTLNNVESANSAGDNYNIREAMLVDAGASALSALFGCCYPNCIFIGHPGYKRMGAKMGYSLISGIVLTLLAVFGLFGLINSLIPLAAVAPILIFIGVVNIEVAFTAVPGKHVVAAAVALLPFVGEFAKEQIDSALKVAGASAADPAILGGLAAEGINYVGYAALASGTIIIAMLMAAIVAFVIDRNMLKTAITSFIGAGCAFFGIIHAPMLAFNASPQLSIAWAIIGVICLIAHFTGVRPQEDVRLSETVPPSGG